MRLGAGDSLACGKKKTGSANPVGQNNALHRRIPKKISIGLTFLQGGGDTKERSQKRGGATIVEKNNGD